MDEPAPKPVDLLRDLRRVFVYDAKQYRRNEQQAFSRLEQQASAAKAYACEKVVQQIDASLRDWA